MNLLKTRTLIAVMSILVLVGLFPSSAGAYSYGNANEEAVAETFKLIAGKLNAEPADWQAAGAAYAEIRAELDSHFGTDVTKELDAAMAAKDKDRVLGDWKGVLVLNLNRRFGSAEQQFDKYADAKLLLAKARATYETLKPYLSGTPAEPKIAELDTAFDKALEGLGNPGLLGVGKKDPNPELFKQNVNLIYSTIEPLFPMQGVAAPAENPAVTPVPHAPMAETNKTNTAVTIIAIAVVLAAAAFFIWRLRRRKG